MLTEGIAGLLGQARYADVSTQRRDGVKERVHSYTSVVEQYCTWTKQA